MSNSERLQFLVRMALLIFVLASAAFLSALTAMRFAIQGRIVDVPTLVGMKLPDAQAALAHLGLGIKVEDRVYSPLPVDAVVRQSPPPGMRVKVGQWAHVVLSLGGQKASIPVLTNQSERAARIELLQTGLQIGEVSSVYLSGTDPDMVTAQNPPAGAPQVTSPRVDLLISLGPRPAAYVMPDLAGLTLLDAQRRLSLAGLKLAKINTMPLTGAPAGRVTAQLPVAGSRVETGSSVELEVAD